MYETVETVLLYAIPVLAALVVLANGLAPLTKTKLDDKLGGIISWVVDKLVAIILPFVRAKAQEERDQPKV